MDITSDDKYHHEQGLKILPEHIKLAEKYMDKIDFRGAGNTIIPLGRAKTRKRSYIGYKSQCINVCKTGALDISIKNNGKIYPCCFPFFEYPGNIFEEPLLDIIKKARKDPRLIALNSDGLRRIAKVDGHSLNKIYDLIRTLGECGACAKLYGNQ